MANNRMMKNILQHSLTAGNSLNNILLDKKNGEWFWGVKEDYASNEMKIKWFMEMPLS